MFFFLDFTGWVGYHKRVFTKGMMDMPQVAIIMGSANDYPILEPACKLLEHFGVSYTVRVLSAHRTPREAADFAGKLEEMGVQVVIAAAGKAAALPGVIAAHTLLPVIGLPIKSSTMDGMDSLLSIVQMPPGIPVATVAINGGENAALLAVQIMTLTNPELKKAFAEHRKQQTQKVLEQDRQLQLDIAAK